MFLRAVTASAVVVLFTVPVARANVISGITVSANVGGAPGYNLNNLVNGAGLTGGMPSLDAQHAFSAQDNAWQSSPTMHIYFNLNGEYDVTTACIWPWSYGPASPDSIQLAYSPNGSNYYVIPGITQLPFPGTYANGWPTRWDFDAVTATHMRLSIFTNWGYRSPSGFAYTGLNEVQFGATPVPEPASVGLLALGGWLLFGRKK